METERDESPKPRPLAEEIEFYFKTIDFLGDCKGIGITSNQAFQLSNAILKRIAALSGARGSELRSAAGGGVSAILRELGPWTLTPRGFDKHYGTVLRAGECKIVIWKTESYDYPLGDAAHSCRETEPVDSHYPLGGHYESVSDLRIAEALLEELNAPRGNELQEVR